MKLDRRGFLFSLPAAVVAAKAVAVAPKPHTQHPTAFMCQTHGRGWEDCFRAGPHFRRLENVQILGNGALVMGPGHSSFTVGPWEFPR